ncbi:response regulator [Candidatus Woesearchaeota archaeon]|nr:response regulator [Candidatus Woesearchaeota archaeon]
MAKTVLVVDDSSFTRNLLKNMILEVIDVSVIEASDGNEAIAMFDEMKPDMVFMDVMMPNLNGLEALKQIIGRDADAKVVIYTSTQQNVVAKEAVDAGASDFITKPITKESIVAIINKYLK